MLYEEFLIKRIASLRSNKNISANAMSEAIGCDSSYINKIENGKALPSMKEFFNICNYLGVTPQEFFNENGYESEVLDQLTEDWKKVNPNI